VRDTAIVTSPADLVSAALAAVPPGERDELSADPALGDLLMAMVAAARAAWPELALPADELVGYVAARLPAGAAAALASGPRVADLALAFACARGDPAAVAAFQLRYFGEVEAAGARMRCAADVVAEARQNLARMLFTGEPAITKYSGRGDLRGWIRVTATRELLRLQELTRREVQVTSDDMFDALSPAADPELAFLKDHYRHEFADAFRAAVAALSDRERALFRRQLVDGWGIDEIAAHHGVHRSTAARWLAAARQTLLDETRERLKARWGATTLEVDSVIRLLTSRLDVSLEGAITARSRTR
jgi:RNA polymerase sigma-70 factor (ECF subfamily)